jgi:zinc protease
VERTHPDFYTLQVLDAILGAGAGLTARIPRRLRDEQGLAYTTFASITNSAGLAPGKFLAYIGTAPANVDRAIGGFLDEIDTIRDEVVSGEELSDAQDYLTGSFVFGFETNAQIARFLVNAEVYGLGFDYIESYPRRIRDVTAAGLRQAARRHLSTEDYVLVVAGPEEARSAERLGG